VIETLNGLVAEFPRCGFWKYVGVLSLSAYPWSHKRLHWVCCTLGLNQQHRTKRRLQERDPTPLVLPQRHNQVWSADFMSGALYRVARFRLFNVNDDFNRESVAIEIDASIRSERTVRMFEHLKAERGLPDMLRVDNGPEFLGQAFVDWCQANGVFIDYIEFGKPNQNTFIERFNRSLRNEVLDLFRSFAGVREIVSQWLRQYNEDRPHDALDGLPPVIYAKRNLENSTFELST
jgi:putative transposase